MIFVYNFQQTVQREGRHLEPGNTRHRNGGGKTAVYEISPAKSVQENTKELQAKDNEQYIGRAEGLYIEVLTQEG